MTNLDIADEIKKMPVTQRIEILEVIAQSLRNEIEREPAVMKSPFKVRKFNLGQEVHVDRDDIYSERGF